jgi:hypothetical protein
MNKKKKKNQKKKKKNSKGNLKKGQEREIIISQNPSQLLGGIRQLGP